MRDLSFFCLSILTSSLFSSTCFLCGMGIIGCRFGYLTLTIYTMMSPPNTLLKG
jgi:hypothetical protein